MFMREESVHIEASPEAVYDYVSDIGRHPEWAAQKLLMQPLGDGRFESTMHMWPLKAVSVINIETAERPRTFVYVADDNVSGPHRWRFDITPDSGGSNVKFTLERMHEGLFMRLVQPVIMFPLIGRPGMVTALRNIKGTIEGATREPNVAPSPS
jgi:hypothetical protein